MAGIKCFDLLGLDAGKLKELTTNFNDLVTKGMSDREAGLKIANDLHKDLHTELDNFKRKISPNPNSYVKEPFKPFDNSQKVKEINDNYDKLISDKKNELEQKQKSEAPIVKDNSILPVGKHELKLSDFHDNSEQIIKDNPNATITLYHGTVNEIKDIKDDRTQGLYFTPSIQEANNYNIAQNNNAEGEYGHIYKVSVPLRDLEITNDIDNAKKGSKVYYSPNETYFRIDNPLKYKINRVDDAEVLKKFDNPKAEINQPNENKKDNSIVEDKQKQTTPIEDKGNEPIESEKEPPPPETPENKNVDNEDKGNTVGVSHKSLSKLAKEIGLPEVERGERLSPKQYADRGRLLLDNGADLKKVEDDFKNGKQPTADDISIARAHLEDLEKIRNKIGDDKNLGIKSKEYKKAEDDVDRWIREVQKPMGTAASEPFTALQGERNIDTGSFTSLRTYFKEENDKEPTLSEEKDMTNLSSKVKELEGKVEDLSKQISETLKNNLKDNEGNKASFTDKTKKIADNFRKLKSKPFVFKDSNGNEYNLQKSGISWNDIVELGAKAIEASGKIADGIAKVIDEVKNLDWYKKLSDVDKESLERQLEQHYTDNTTSKEEKISASRIKALEKKLSDLQEGNKKNNSEKREPTNKEKELKDLISKEKDKQNFNSLVERFADKNDNKFSPEDAKDIWDYATKTYLDKDGDFNGMITKTGADLGLTPDQVIRSLEQQKGVKRMTDEMYRKQRDRRLAQKRAVNYVKTANNPKAIKFLKTLSQLPFRVTVFGHGTVGFITHAGTSIFNPMTWHVYWPLFFKQFRLAYGDIAHYEKAMADLKRDDLFVTAKKGGLAVDPDNVYDDYQTSDNFLKKISFFGERGFNVLKMLRLELFKNEFNKLSDAEKADPEVTKSIATIINHGTGTSDVKMPDAANFLIFAARLEGSRWNRMIMQPIDAATTFSRWDKSSAADKVAAKIVAKRAASIMGTYVGMLLANQALLSLTGSKQSVNFTNPLQSDFLKFKAGGKQFDLSGGMISTFDFISRILAIPFENKKQLGKNTKGEKAASTFTGYLSNKLSPFASDAKELLTAHDYSGNTLPFSNDKPYYKDGHKMTWLEYIESKLPIPAAAWAKDVHDQMKDKGVSSANANIILGGLFIGAMEGGTGARITEEYKYPERQDMPSNFPDAVKKDYERTSDEGFLPPQIEARMIYKGHQIDLNNKQYQDFSNMVNNERTKASKSITDDPDYNQASDEERKKMLKSGYEYARKVAKYELLNKYPGLKSNVEQKISNEQSKSQQQREARSGGSGASNNY